MLIEANKFSFLIKALQCSVIFFFLSPVLANPQANAEYDYIVVGAGVGGGPLASRLAENGYSVLLLEAGELKEEDKIYTEIPVLHTKASERKGISWQYFVEHYSDPERARLDSKRCPGPDGCGYGKEGVLYPRGATIGGSGSVNAMISLIPHDSDWNRIADITGDSTWSAPSMREYLIKAERNLYGRDESDGHGTKGWLPLNHNATFSDDTDGPVSLTLDVASLSSYLDVIIGGHSASGRGTLDHRPLIDFFGISDINRLRDSSIPPLSNVEPQDPNDPGLRVAPFPHEPMGFYPVPVSVDENGRRGGVAQRILETVASPAAPLTLKTGALVSKVLFETSSSPSSSGPKAIGVEYLDAPQLYRGDSEGDENAVYEKVQVYAKREIILSAGAFNTPQLLMLSGIGPRAHLESVGLDVLVDLPGVGQNLQDRYEIPVIVKKRNFLRNKDINFPALVNCNFDPEDPDFEYGDCYQTWLSRGKGIYSQPGAFSSFVKRSSEFTMNLNVVETSELEDPDLYIFGVGGTFKGYYPGYSEENFTPASQFTWVVLKGHSHNSGLVELRSNDPRDTPRINFKYYGDPAAGVMPSDEHLEDLNAVVKGIKLARAAIRSSNNFLFPFLAKYDEVWPGREVDTDDELREFAMNESWGHHASCTAKIGVKEDPMAVLDSNFNVHNTQGLRVVDASVFPEIPGLFPTVAIAMLSEKAADVIMEDARRVDQAE